METRRRGGGELVRGMGWAGFAVVVLAAAVLPGWGESCTTQSQMKAADRDGMAAAAQALAARMQAGDVAGVQAQTVPELQRDFGAARQAVVEVAGHLKGDRLEVQQVYLLDATGLQAGADAQFFCSLSGSQAEVDFSIRGLTAGVYGFAVVAATGGSPWRVAELLRREGGQWLLAGFFPGPTAAGGHDGLWYWTEARRVAAAKQPWSAWLLYGQARELLQPAAFVQTTHLEKLEEERKTAAPPALSGGLSEGTPLVLQGADGKEYRITGLTTQAADGAAAGSGAPLNVVVTVEGTAGDAAAVRAQSDGAARALVGTHPELRGEFRGVLVSLQIPGQSAFVTGRTMAEVR